MKTLPQHILESAQALGCLNDPALLHDHVRRFVPPLGAARIPVPGFAGAWTAADSTLALQGLRMALEEDSFSIKRSDGARGALVATLTHDCQRTRDFPQLPRMPAEFTVQLDVEASAGDDGTLHLVLSAPLPSWSRLLQARVADHVASTPEAFRAGAQTLADGLRPADRSAREALSRGRIIAPGELPQQAPAGDARDYAGCATEAELAGLHPDSPQGLPRVLPLGRYHRFGDGRGTAPLLYLPGTAVPPGSDAHHPAPHELPHAYQGTLVVAPQDSGKTKLIVRWAKAANRAGYSLFLVDVKGNLHDKLRAAGLHGELLHFSTQPGVPSDRINFLAGLGHVTDRALAWQVRQLAHAILPDQGFEEGEQQYYLQNRLVWLRALIHLLKLKEAYLPKRFVDPQTGRKRTADLADLYEFIADPPALYEDLKRLLHLEDSGLGRYRRDQVFGGAKAWIARAALLFGRDDVPGGQRGPQATYQEYAQGLLTPLESFSRAGLLCEKVRDGIDSAAGRLFSLDQLGQAAQVTILLTAREQELDDAVTVTSMAVKRLQQLLFDRVGQPKRPILLLLDETRRIRSFRPGQYITFAREAMAGCVIVYQSLDQIVDEREIVEIMENVGTQIYLNGAVGKTAARLIEFLPKRWRPAFSRSWSTGMDGSGSSGTWEQRQELGDFFQTGDLFRLPTGPRGALVYLKNHAGGRPFIVDLDEDRNPELA